MKNLEISELYEKLKDRKEKFRYWQHVQENLKYEHNMFDPYDYPDIDEWDYQLAVQRGIHGNSLILQDLEKEIKDIKKQLKIKQREYEIQNTKTCYQKDSNY